MPHEKYFLMNAVLPVEAYDPEGGVTDDIKNAMTPADWRPYPDRVRSTHWHELFLDTPGDARQGLTWKGLFRDVDNTINFYSSKDEVVANGNGNWKWPLTRKFAWYNQERARGSYLVSFSPQAGWEFSDHYVKEVYEGILNGEQVYSYRKYTPEETASIADTNLMVYPFFKDFSDGQIYGEGGSAFLQANEMVRWYALSHGIPAESFAAGANPVPKWGRPLQGEASGQTDSDDVMIRNADMARDCVPAGRKELPWIHSYFIQNSLFDTQVLYEVMVKQIGSTKPQNSKEAK